MSDSIFFHSKDGSFAWLSPMNTGPLVIQGEHWPSAEHFYQAMSVAALNTRQVIREARTGEAARELAHAARRRDDWEKVRASHLEDALRAALAQTPDLLRDLQATASRKLIYSSPDPFWGQGTDEGGFNQLGHLWMRLRLELSSTTTAD